MAAAIRKKGQVRTTSRLNSALVASRQRHHAQSSSATGKNTTCPFARSASRKKTKDAMYAVDPPNRRLASLRKKQKIDNRTKNIERTFFSSEIHATDSALTGWIPKMSPATQAPGTLSRRKTNQTSNALAACRTILPT